MVGTGMLCGCSKATSAPPPRPAAPVQVANVVAKDLPIEVHTFGLVEAYQTINVKGRVGGQLAKVLIDQGQAVNEGTPMFTIDPQPFQAAVNQFEANRNRDSQQMGLAQREAERAKKLFDTGAATADERDIAITGADAAEATVEADRATLETARLQLSYCFISAPVTGVLGKVRVDRGNIVTANVDTLVVLNQIEPINVTFTVPEKHLPDIRARQGQHPLPVEVTIAPDCPPETGKLTFIDNTVTTTTGAIALLGEFPNKDHALWPGQYFPVTLILGTRKDAVLIPSKAILSGIEGDRVFVLKPDQTAELRPVTLGPTSADMTIIEKGLAPGETVITEGHQRLANGAKVAVLKNK